MDAEERRHFINLRAQYVKRLRILELRRAQQGLETPPSVIIEIDDIQKQIADIDERLSEQEVILLPSDGEKSLIEIVVKGDANILTSEKERTIKGVLAALMDIPPEQVIILGIFAGSIIFLMRLPKDSAQRLLYLFNSEDINLQQLGIQKVEVLPIAVKYEKNMLYCEKRIARLNNKTLFLSKRIKLLFYIPILSVVFLPFISERYAPVIGPIIIISAFISIIIMQTLRLRRFRKESLIYQLQIFYKKLSRDVIISRGYNPIENLKEYVVQQRAAYRHLFTRPFH